MKFITGTPSTAMISVTTVLLSSLLAIVSGAVVSSAPEGNHPHTSQVQHVLQTINRMVHQQVLELSADRHMNGDQEVEESLLRELPRVNGDRVVGGDGARGARQVGEMIGSFLGSGLDEVLTNIRPTVIDIFGPFMTTLGITLLEWFSYTDHKTKTAAQENDSKMKTQNIYEAFEVEFPEYGKFLVLSERKDGFSKDREGLEGQKGDDDVSVDGEKRRGLVLRNLEKFDSRFRWIGDRDMDRRFQIN